MKIKKVNLLDSYKNQENFIKIKNKKIHIKKMWIEFNLKITT